MGQELVSLIKTDRQLTRKIKTEGLEAEDRLRVLQQQRAVLAKANQIADRAIKQKNLQQ